MSIGVSGPAFSAQDDVSHPRAGRLDRASRLFLSAAQRALPSRVDGTLGIFVATAHGAFAANAEHWGHVLASGLHAVSPLVFPATVPSAAAGEAAIALSATGPSVTLCGEAEAARAIVAMARHALLARECDHVLVGAVIGWHPALTRLGLEQNVCDGAVVVHLPSAPLRTKPAAAHPLFNTLLQLV